MINQHFDKLFPKHSGMKKNKMTNIVKVLNSFKSSEVYEALYLFWLGISTDSHSEKKDYH